MVNGMYCAVEPYVEPPSCEEKLYTESRQTFEYLKTAHRRMLLLVKRQAHYRRNPLGGAMCRELDTQIYQLRLMLARFHADLNAMVDQYNILAGADDDSQVSTKADWEEVMEMANRPADAAASRARPVPSTHNNSSSTTVAADSSACGSQPHSASHASPMSGTTASPSPSAEQKPKATQHAPFPWCSTPPMEEVVELRQHLREIEQSPLFTDSPPLHRLHRQAPLLPVQQRTPSSLP